MNQPTKTALYELHNELGGNIIDFHGTFLPVLYSSIAEEHEAVRSNIGFFDVSHMGNILLSYNSLEDARRHLNWLLPNDYSKIVPGKVIYSTMLYENGTVIDDLLVMCLTDTNFHVVVNAGNIKKDYDWISNHTNNVPLTLDNTSSETSIVALQGPNAWKLLADGMGLAVADLRFFRVIQLTWEGNPLTIARTGYTGEDGFEIFIDNNLAYQFTREMVLKGELFGIKPCGLGARDTLRLEAALPLYGQDMDDNHSPLQSMVHWSAKPGKAADFIGKEALLANPRDSFNELLTGFEVNGRAIPRTGMQIKTEDGTLAGTVTSGTFTPFLKKNIGLAYLNQKLINAGPLNIEARNKSIPITVVPLPFYKRSR